MFNSTLHVFTYKAGLLARVAHDLRLRVQRYDFVVQQRRVQGHCDTASLCVEGAMTSHGLEPNALSDSDKQKILETVRTEILLCERFPRVEFEGQLESHAGLLQIAGTLNLRGHSQSIRSELIAHSTLWQARFEITPSHFGIAPYKALAGAIRLQDRVTVVADLQLGTQTPTAILDNPDPWHLTSDSSA